MTPRDTMYKKFEVMEDLQLTSNLLTLQANVLEWVKAKPNNKKLNEVCDAVVKISFTCNKLQLEKNNYHIAMQEYRHDSLRAVERAMKAEDKITELEKQLAIYKKKEELGL
jgi:hypothetical protein|tara:strand:+ start:151 stop:483 length:333 start_codon:yes stop_codon:yes gene_type:complete